MSNNQSILELNNISKEYPTVNNKTVQILSDISFSVNKEEIVILMGPSGSGKSTLLNIITGLERPTTGNVKIDGKDFFGLSEDERTEILAKDIGVIFQFFELHKGLTCKESIELGLIVSDSYNADSTDEINKLLIDLGLDDKRDQLIDTCSRREKQRIAIGRALIKKPKILIANEPTGALNYELALEVISSLRKIVKREKITLLVATHDFNIIRDGDRIITIENGTIIDDIPNINRESYIVKHKIIL